MKEQTKRGKALSLALTASLVATLNVPAIAFADEASDRAGEASASQLNEQDAVGQATTDEGQNVDLLKGSAAEANCGVDPAGADAPQASPLSLGSGETRAQTVASVAEREYSSLDEAIAAANDGETVKVLVDTTMGMGTVAGKSISFDLNGCKVTSSNFGFWVEKGGRLTLEDTAGGGSLKAPKAADPGGLSVGVALDTEGSFVMKGGAIESSDYGVFANANPVGSKASYISIEGGSIKSGYGVGSVGNGAEHSARVEISGGEITGSIFGFAMNGSAAGVDLVMTGGSVVSTGEGTPAMYLPAPKSTTVISGGVVRGDTGIEIRAGELTVSGDVEVIGAGKLAVNPNGSGATTSGAGIAVAQHATKQPINVVVVDGAKVVGVAAVYESNPQKNEAEAVKQVKISLEGGVFESTNPGADGASVVYSEDCAGFVSGGAFNAELPISLLSEGRAMLVDEDGAAVVMTEADAAKDAGAFVEKDGKKVYYTTSQAAENANPDGSGDVKTYCATAGGVKYTSLAEAVAAASAGAEVALIADVAESLTVPAGKSIVLDLAGFTLSGSDNGKGGVSNVITNQGTLVIKDSSAAQTGTVMGGADTGSGVAGRTGIALVNEGTCTIEGGAIKRGDDGTFGNYTVYNKQAGTMIVKGGVVTNNSGKSSLIRNDGAMEITGGEITQMKFNAVKNDSGKLTVSGGIISSGDQALQNWCEATIKGGTLNGAVYTWAAAIDDESYRFLTVIEGGTVNGDVVAVNYDGSDSVAHVVISGPATINGDVASYAYNGGAYDPADNGEGLLIEISDGTFAGDVDADFIVPGAGLEVDESGNLVAVEAKLVTVSDKVVNGVYTLDVVGAQPITEADLLALVGMNVDIEKSGYTIGVDATNLPALNKAIGAKDTAATFAFAYTATKDGAQTYVANDAVEPLTITVKLIDSSTAGGSGDSGSVVPGGSAGSAGEDKPSKNEAALVATGDDTVSAAGVAGAAAFAAAAAAAAGAIALSRRKQS